VEDPKVHVSNVDLDNALVGMKLLPLIFTLWSFNLYYPHVDTKIING